MTDAFNTDLSHRADQLADDIRHPRPVDLPPLDLDPQRYLVKAGLVS